MNHYSRHGPDENGPPLGLFPVHTNILYYDNNNRYFFKEESGQT